MYTTISGEAIGDNKARTKSLMCLCKQDKDCGMCST